MDRAKRAPSPELQATAHRARARAGHAGLGRGRQDATWTCWAASPPARFGHCHPEVTAAAKAQLDRLWHISNVFYTEPQIALAELLTSALAAWTRALLLQLRRGGQRGAASSSRARRRTTAASRGASRSSASRTRFHGRTLATVTATGQPKYQKGFEPLPAGVVHVPYGDLEAVRQRGRARGPPPSSSSRSRARAGCAPRPTASSGRCAPSRDEHRRPAPHRRGADRAWAAPGRCSPSSTRASGPTGSASPRRSANGLPIGAMVCTRGGGEGALARHARLHLRRKSGGRGGGQRHRPHGQRPAVSPPTSRRASTSSPAGGRCRAATRRW